MTEHSRRTFIGGAAVAGGSALVGPLLGTGEASAAAGPGGSGIPGPITIRPDDPRYVGLVAGSNQRWVGTPDYIRVVGSADQVVQAVQEAVDARRRVAVRSGGHCDEDFTANRDVRVVIDLAGLDTISYDERMGAFAVEPGATLGRTYRTLYKGWGVTIPGGTCPTVGVGGHIVGGGYGALSRMHGLTVDHLHAVEVVVVSAAGRARKVVATRDPADPNHDLFWAHTGAGGGNFGIVTKYWLRTPGTGGRPPQYQLPRPPREVILSDVAFSWDGMTEAAFTRLVGNFSRWHELHSAPDDPYVGLFSQLKTQHRAAGSFRMSTQIDASLPDAEGMLDAFLASVVEGTGRTYHVNDRSRSPWLNAVTEWFGFVEAAIARWKVKSAYLRKSFPQDQLKALYRQQTRTDHENPFNMVAVVGFGGAINRVPAKATAVAQRDSVAKMLYVSLWTDPDEDAVHERWVRECYADVYAASGGVPKLDGVNDGCYINYADADLVDLTLNTSGVAWHDLYFKGGYQRLQQVKRRWDPRDIFTHALAIRP